MRKVSIFGVLEKKTRRLHQHGDSCCEPLGSFSKPRQLRYRLAATVYLFLISSPTSLFHPYTFMLWPLVVQKINRAVVHKMSVTFSLLQIGLKNVLKVLWGQNKLAVEDTDVDEYYRHVVVDVVKHIQNVSWLSGRFPFVVCFSRATVVSVLFFKHHGQQRPFDTMSSEISVIRVMFWSTEVGLASREQTSRSRTRLEKCGIVRSFQNVWYRGRFPFVCFLRQLPSFLRIVDSETSVHGKRATVLLKGT